MKEAPVISIGKLAQATGFAVERLRMWELRYGAPRSEKLPSGHRRYRGEEVDRLHLVREALNRGLRPGHVVAQSRESLLKLLETQAPGFPSTRPTPREASALLPWSPKAWVAASQRMDDAYLGRQFYEHWIELGSLRFLTERAQPFVQALGLGWERKELCVAEEHFGSEQLGDFLGGMWRRLNEQNQGPSVLLTTLPGDAHRLGLQMAALVAAMAGLRALYLGPSTPLEEVIEAAKRQKVQGVLLSLSSGQDAQEAKTQLKRLRKGLAPEILLGIGGSGAPVMGPDMPRFQDLPSFYHWARHWAPERSSRFMQAPEGAAR